MTAIMARKARAAGDLRAVAGLASGDGANRGSMQNGGRPDKGCGSGGGSSVDTARRVLSREEERGEETFTLTLSQRGGSLRPGLLR